MTIFETPRLWFRHLTLEDCDDLYRLYSDHDIRRYFPDGVRTAEETNEELEWFLEGHPDDLRLGLWATIEKSSNRFIGRCVLLPWTIDGVLEIEIAYMIDKSRWREGFGSEAAKGLVGYAFSELRLPKVIALIDPEHEASIRTAMSAGLSFEMEIEMEGVLSAVYSLSRNNYCKD